MGFVPEKAPREFRLVHHLYHPQKEILLNTIKRRWSVHHRNLFARVPCKLRTKVLIVTIITARHSKTMNGWVIPILKCWMLPFWPDVKKHMAACLMLFFAYNIFIKLKSVVLRMKLSILHQFKCYECVMYGKMYSQIGQQNLRQK